jgi:hypothetical protein
MPLYLTNYPVMANGNISPSTFVAMDTSLDFSVLQATGVSAPIIGVSQPGTLQPPGLQVALFPGTTPTSQYAAVAGSQLEIFGMGDTCSLTIGAASVPTAQFLTADTNGNGVAATSGNYVGAMTFSSAVAGAVVKVLVLPPGLKA